jgi:hypothetical protein
MHATIGFSYGVELAQSLVSSVGEENTRSLYRKPHLTTRVTSKTYAKDGPLNTIRSKFISKAYPRVVFANTHAVAEPLLISLISYDITRSMHGMLQKESFKQSRTLASLKRHVKYHKTRIQKINA